MHTKTLKKLALALTFWLALYVGSLKAQILGPYGSSPTTFEVDANGLLSDTGTLGTGTLPSNLTGAGTRMFWYPGKAAFRAGVIDTAAGGDSSRPSLGTEWNDANVGQYSVAFGYDTVASGYFSVAFGYQATASGDYSVAFGNQATASGDGSVAFGVTGATGIGSFSASYWGGALNNYAVALGFGTEALGESSFSAGSATMASGSCATAFGGRTSASGNYSTVFGFFTTASAYDSFAVGIANVGGGNPSAWVPTDPLFEVGNGSVPAYGGSVYGNPAASGPSDALVVYKNGDAAVQGTMTAPAFITTSASGDIPMYTGN